MYRVYAGRLISAAVTPMTNMEGWYRVTEHTSGFYHGETYHEDDEYSLDPKVVLLASIRQMHRTMNQFMNSLSEAKKSINAYKKLLEEHERTE